MNDHDLKNAEALVWLMQWKPHRAPYRGRNGSRHIGRLRIRAAEILTAGLGFRVDPDDISPATGAWRTDRRLDVYRWEPANRWRDRKPFEEALRDAADGSGTPQLRHEIIPE